MADYKAKVPIHTKWWHVFDRVRLKRLLKPLASDWNRFTFQATPNSAEIDQAFNDHLNKYLRGIVDDAINDVDVTRVGGVEGYGVPGGWIPVGSTGLHLYRGSVSFEYGLTVPRSWSDWFLRYPKVKGPVYVKAEWEPA